MVIDGHSVSAIYIKVIKLHCHCQVISTETELFHAEDVWDVTEAEEE